MCLCEKRKGEHAQRNLHETIFKSCVFPKKVGSPGAEHKEQFVLVTTKNILLERVIYMFPISNSLLPCASAKIGKGRRFRRSALKRWQGKCILFFPKRGICPRKMPANANKHFPVVQEGFKLTNKEERRLWFVEVLQFYRAICFKTLHQRIRRIARVEFQL